MNLTLVSAVQNLGAYKNNEDGKAPDWTTVNIIHNDSGFEAWNGKYGTQMGAECGANGGQYRKCALNNNLADNNVKISS